MACSKETRVLCGAVLFSENIPSVHVFRNDFDWDSKKLVHSFSDYFFPFHSLNPLSSTAFLLLVFHQLISNHWETFCPLGTFPFSLLECSIFPFSWIFPFFLTCLFFYTKPIEKERHSVSVFSSVPSANEKNVSII